MKKLKRQKLYELAKTMPVLNEEEQRSCNGGTFYYSKEDGTHLGDFGFGDSIRLISSGVYDRLIEDYTMGELNFNDTQSWLNMYSFDVWSGKIDVRNIVVRQLANEVGINHNVYVSDLDRETILGQYNRLSGNIYINSDSLLLDWGSSKYDLMLILIHEECHANDKVNNLGSDASEFKAYNEVFNHPLFQNASPAFRLHVTRQRERYAIASGNVR